MRFFLTLITVFYLFQPAAYAAEDASVSGASDPAQSELQDLVDTLEDDGSREEFVDQLKTMIEVREGTEEPPETNIQSLMAISETLGVEKQTQDMIESYSAFLSDNNLTSSFVGRIVMSVLACAGFLAVLSIVKRLAALGLKKLLSIKQKYSLTHSRFKTYVRVVRYGANFVSVLLLMYTFSLIWGVTDIGLWESSVAVSLVGNTVNVIAIVVIAAILWEGINGFAEYTLRVKGLRNSARTQTLLPIVRNVLFIAFMAVFTLMLLSEIGINIMPLLAGAGVLGIAVGFGAQTVVKDFLSGFTIILEDLIQVGDVVTLSGRSGLVEKITIRKIQMRDLDGTVYTVPYNNIDIIANMTKGYSYYLMDIGIAYREDPDEVIGYLKEIDQEMREDDAYASVILDKIEILGVDNFADSAVVIKARIKTKPREQWTVGREFNRRMKAVFDKNNVEMPFPHQTIYFGEDKEGNAPPAPVALKDKSGASHNAAPQEKDAA